MKWLIKKIKDIDLVEVVGSFVIGYVCLCLLVFILRGCENEKNRISSGIVVNKHSSDLITRYGMRRVREITIRGTKDGEEVEYTINVGDDEFSKYEIGDPYPKEAN